MSDLKKELKKRAFVPQHLLGTIHDPTYEDTTSRAAPSKPAGEHSNHPHLTMVASTEEQKLRAA